MKFSQLDARRDGLGYFSLDAPTDLIVYGWGGIDQPPENDHIGWSNFDLDNVLEQTRRKTAFPKLRKRQPQATSTKLLQRYNVQCRKRYFFAPIYENKTYSA